MVVVLLPALAVCQMQKLESNKKVTDSPRGAPSKLGPRLEIVHA